MDSGHAYIIFVLRGFTIQPMSTILYDLSHLYTKISFSVSFYFNIFIHYLLYYTYLIFI